ncbi:hypothetical protein [Cellulosimicrobium cellulans]|uniref:hypothetical protein n=1 Tax=Cellulosimicrobium cellulans TaxID=1710 RepID=UPI002406F18A|nr:hypothetical protein [Cellulosimicrobium cellulans]MDF9875994.1 hypothetical protein [Cellulosimicrobium cellulans]
MDAPGQPDSAVPAIVDPGSHVAEAMGGSSSWRTFADWAINEALRYPAHVWYESRNDTYVDKTEIQIRDRSGRVRDVKYSNVVVARVSKNIITTYPSNA